MELPVLLDKKGMTLVEVMIALVVLLFVSLAMMQTALVGIDSNMINILRDEAVSIAEEKMNEARNMAFDSLMPGTTYMGTGTPPKIKRNLRNITDFEYTVTRTISNLGTDNKQVTITVTWDWKEKTVTNNNPYTHSITTIVRK